MTESVNRNRPEQATDEVLEYLDALRMSGATNMFGAGQYLQDEFNFNRNVARTVLTYWMNDKERHN